MNLNKHRDFFNPDQLTEPVHIIGVGAMGSHIAEGLVRLGVTRIHIYDFDTVDPHNLTNQIYLARHIGLPKTEALETYLKEINPELQIRTHKAWNKMTPLLGYVFIAVDNIETRKEIVQSNWNNFQIRGMFDTRMRLTDAQVYAADWTKEEQKTLFRNTMQFTREEAAEATPVNACGTTLSVAPVVKTAASLAVSSFVNLLLEKPEFHQQIFIDAFAMTLMAY